MFDFHYNHLLKEINPNNVKLLFTDTDSLVYEFSNIDIKHHYNNLINNNLLDTSTYKFNNELLELKTNINNEIGIMKYNNNIITEFIGLRSKMYILKLYQISKNLYLLKYKFL